MPDVRSLGAIGRVMRSRSTVPPDQWPQVVAVAQADGLRAAGQRFGVSHESIRRIVQQMRPSPLSKLDRGTNWEKDDDLIALHSGDGRTIG